MRERRWIDVDDAELAAITTASNQGPDALRACLDGLWDNAWNSGTAHTAGERDDDEPMRPGDDERVILDAVTLPDGPVDLTAAPPAQTGAERVRDAHTEHCCVVHGCKYGNPDCTVTAGAGQSSPCHTCKDDGIVWSTAALDAVPDGTPAINAAGVVAQRRAGAWHVVGSAQPITSAQYLAGQYVRVLAR